MGAIFNGPAWGGYEYNIRVKAEILPQMLGWKEVFCFTSESFTLVTTASSAFSKHILWIVASFYVF